MYYCMHVNWIITLYTFVVINYHGGCVCVVANLFTQIMHLVIRGFIQYL